MNETITLTLSNGNELPLRHYQSKAGNDCFGILAKRSDGSRYLNKYGVNVQASVIGDVKKVKSISVLGQTFPVTTDKNEKGQPVLRASGSVRVENQEKALSFRITVRDEGFNISGSINGKRGGNGAPALGSDDL